MRNILLLLMLLDLSCRNGPAPETAYPKGTFGYDLTFLQRYDSVIVLAKGESQLVVSPKYQAKVFTSTALGPNGPSYGWIHYPAFDAPHNPHMNAYGGENRLWLGPEGGPYSLFFAPGDSMVFDRWKTPAAFDSEPWTVAECTATDVRLQKAMHLKNYTGAVLPLEVSRRIHLLTPDAIDSVLSLHMGKDIKAVGYETTNSLSNPSNQPVCLWLLDMFPTSEHTVILLPFKPGPSSPASTHYFGDIPADRLRWMDRVLLFKADGRSRGKLGIHPGRALTRAGSYDPTLKVLTVIQYDLSPDQPYLNQEWTTSKPPFSGDAVNAYNDGPLANGTQMGPFYELESVSPVVKGSLTHRHLVFHFTGDENALSKLSVQLLGLSLQDARF